MQRNMRSISIDVCDYTGANLCNLYNNSNDMPGQAHDVYVHTERNGFKELRFNLPSVLPSGERNHRMDFLISDYRIKFQTMKSGQLDVDWFLISEAKITHEAFSEDYEVKANHISYLLNTKNLELEFSDDEGNNTGTIGEIAATILEGTGWHLGDVRHFYEETKYGFDNVEKVRSFTASSQTGAFKMISDLCELFDAKPLYHGEGMYLEDGEVKIGRTVDLIPMNPFSKDLEEGAVPQEVLEGESVLELYYDKNIHNVTRTLNTENIVTKLSGYGSSGDRNGICSLQQAKHTEITFNEPVGIGTYCFEWADGKYFFTSTAATNSLKWSSLDFSSRSYVYDGTNLYRVFREYDGSYKTLTTKEETVMNYVPYLLDFTYYDKIGLLTDDMLRVIAEHQTNIPTKHLEATEASIALSAEKESLMKTASAGEGFLMLDVKKSDMNKGYVRLTINKTSEHSDGVIYRSDYDEAKRNYFTLTTASGLKTNGEAIAGKGAVIYIVHEGNPTQWEKCYVKAYGNASAEYYRDSLGNNYVLHNEEHYDRRDGDEATADETYFPAVGQSDLIYVADKDRKMYVWFNNDYQQLLAADYYFGLNEFDEPDTITLWTDNDTWHSSDKVYLFSADSIAGLFGPREDEVLANSKSIEETTKTVTDIHPMKFIYNNEALPDPGNALLTYGWCYRVDMSIYDLDLQVGELYFCWGEKGDSNWRKVCVSTGDEDPETLTPTAEYGYYYSTKRMMLYMLDNKWVPVKDTPDYDRITQAFKSVIEGCMKQELLIKGMKEEYYYEGTDIIPQGNYAFKNEFNYFIMFTTTKAINLSEGDQLRYYQNTRVIWQDNNDKHILKPSEGSFTDLIFPKANDLSGVVFGPKNYKDGTFSQGENYNVSTPIQVYYNTRYDYVLPKNTIIVCCDTNNRFLSQTVVSNTRGYITTPAYTSFIYIVTTESDTSSFDIHVHNYTNVFFRKDKMYTILTFKSSGERLGLSYLMDKFISTAHEAYEVKLPQLRAAQKAITDAIILLSNTLGDIYREGTWRKDDYVEGDELKLYVDTLDNLKEISHPEATYEMTFIDRYGSQPLTEDEEVTQWPDIEITYAAHLVDRSIDINQWAYIDSIDKCYDQPWKTTLEINTRLSMIGQQSFTDVLAKIAEVANETKANQSIYKRASALTNSGQLAAERLKGAIETNKILILGGTSNWYTDSKGNIIFESADGGSAMMLTGRGWAIADTKDIYGDWDWRYMATGKGLTADAIYTGYLSAERIEAGSITTDKLSATVGQELEIGSNKSLALYATIDGERPAGSLITQHPQASDSWVAIGAQSDNNPAYIDIQSGGQVNLYGGSEINIDSQGALNLSGATVDLTSNGKMTIDGGTIDVKSSGVLLVDSENFTIKKNETTGKYDVTIKGNITTTGGKIAGFTIGSASNRDYMYAGQTVTVNSNANGVYLGTDGINVAGKFKFSADGNTAKLNVNASDITLGDIAGFTSLSGKLGDMDTKTSTAQSTADTAKTNAATAQSTADTAKTNAAAAQKTADNIANGTTAVPKVETTGIKIYKGADNKGHIEVGSTGTIDMLANSSLTFATSSSNSAFVLNNDGVSIGSAKDISIAAGGTFTISSGKFKIKNDGTVEIDGKITTTSGSIGTWTIGADYIGNASTKNNSTVGIANASGNNDIVFWAGGKYNGTGTNAPKFSVTKAGKLVASGAEIKGDSTFSGTLSADCLTSGTLNASKVTVSNLSANSITSGIIDASKISVTNLNASNITSGTMSANKISGGSIDATNVTITNLNASNITSGTMSANKISGGSIDATNVTITNLNASNITSGTMSASKISGGTLTLGGNSNGNGTLVINNASNVQIGSWNNSGITATAGTIAGWTINEKSLTSGTNTSHITLNADMTTTTANVKDYAIWVGNDLPESNPDQPTSAPFRVKRDGTLYATKFVIWSEPTAQYPDGKETVIDLSKYQLWKLNYHTVKSYDTDSITLSNGEKINFINASSLSIGTDGANITYILNKGTKITGTDFPVGVIAAEDGHTYYVNTHEEEINVTIKSGDTIVGSGHVKVKDGSGDGLAYDSGYGEGWKAAGRSVGNYSVTAGTGLVTLTVPSSTTSSGTTSKNGIVSLSQGNWSNGDLVVTAKFEGSEARTTTVNVGTASDWAATYTSSGKMSVSMKIADKAFSSGEIDDPGYKRGWNDARSDQITIGTCYEIIAHSGDWVKVNSLGTGYSRVPLKS